MLLDLDAVCEPVGPLFRGAVPLDQPLQGHRGEEESSKVTLQCSPASWLPKGCSITESLVEVGASCTTEHGTSSGTCLAGGSMYK